MQYFDKQIIRRKDWGWYITCNSCFGKGMAWWVEEFMNVLLFVIPFSRIVSWRQLKSWISANQRKHFCHQQMIWVGEFGNHFQGNSKKLLPSLHWYVLTYLPYIYLNGYHQKPVVQHITYPGVNFWQNQGANLRIQETRSCPDGKWSKARVMKMNTVSKVYIYK